MKRLFGGGRCKFKTTNQRNDNVPEYEEIRESDRINSAGRAAYVERNQWMVDESKYVIFCLNENRESTNKKSGAMIAYQYAINGDKVIYYVAESGSRSSTR